MSRLKTAVDTVINVISARFSVKITPPPLPEKGGGIVVMNDNAEIEWQSLNLKHARISVPMTMLIKHKTAAETFETAAQIQEYLTEPNFSDFKSDEVQICGFKITNGTALAEKDEDCIYQLQFAIKYAY